MKFTAFHIKNYKGVNDATVSLNGSKGTIYTLVGLNESGKTTILEAINNFRHDVDGIHAIAQQAISTDPIAAWVPKKRKDNFNGDISVIARVKLEESEIEQLATKCKTQYGFELDTGKFPLAFNVERCHTFQSSKHKISKTKWSLFPVVKKKRGRKFVRVAAKDSEWQDVVREIGGFFPRIIYFPTFLFDFPERINISDEEGEVKENEYFKKVLEDALASLDDPLHLKTHIVERALNKDPELPFGIWLGKWVQSDESEQVATALAKLSQKISKEIFERWKDVLGSDIGKKEIVIEPVMEEGDEGQRKMFVTLKVKDGYSAYRVSERSLGFRWFFCFLLFTRFFRGNESGGESIFLFDEPASNLHSKAQTKLLDSLKVIAGGKNDIIYSTHSHHLINPLWLETASVVTNGPPNDGGSLDADVGVQDTDIRVQLYRTFVGENAEKSHYFQPILGMV